MTRAHHKTHRSTPRTRNAAQSSPARMSASDGANAVPVRDHSPAGPTVDAPLPLKGPRVGDALALCGLLFSTLDPRAAFEFLTKIAVFGADVILAIGARAQRAAELAGQEARE